MASAINDLLVSEMTLLWSNDTGDQQSSGVDIVPYTWQDNISHKNIPGVFGGSFLNLVTSLDNDAQYSSLSSCSCGSVAQLDINTGRRECCAQSSCSFSLEEEPEVHQKKTDVTAHWYNYCKSFVDESHEKLNCAAEAGDLKRPQGPTVVVQEEDLVLPCELKVQGTFVHPNIITGFRYVVRPADSKKPLFNGQALQLTSIGRGYGKRLTFESESKLQNDNYFYSDTNTYGYGFKLVVLEKGERFTITDSAGSAVGFAAVLQVNEEDEVEQEIHGIKLVKRVNVSFKCRVDFFTRVKESPEEISFEGCAVVQRETSRAAAKLIKIVSCSPKGRDTEYTLQPGTSDRDRLSFVSGEAVGDISTSYILRGLLPRELPVIGTYVHPNIIIGAKYKVRSLATNKYLFEGAALTLQSIGRGYGKRITFNSDSSLYNDNYFYSDTCEEGYGFTIEAISVGDQFCVMDDRSVEVGRGEVYRTDAPQLQKVDTNVAEAEVHLEVTCHFNNFSGYEDCTTTLTGVAHVVKSRKQLTVTAIEGVKLGGSLANLSTSSLRAVMSQS